MTRPNILSVIGALLFAFLALSWCVPQNFDSDTALLGLMSSDRVTLFYWAQGRLVNFFPWIFSWILSARLNVYVQEFALGACFFFLLEAISRHVSHYFELKRSVAFFTLILASLVLFKKFGLYIVAYAAQPYASSFLFCIWSFEAWSRRSLAHAAVAIALMIVSTGLNPSVVLFSGLICVICLIEQWRPKYLVLTVLYAVFAVLWQYLGNEAGKYSIFNPHWIAEGISGAIGTFADKVGNPYRWLAMLVGGLPVILWRAKGWKQYTNIALVLAFCVCWVLLFSANNWVRLNLYMWRYFFPVCLVAPIAASTALTMLVSTRWVAIVAAALSISITGIGFSSFATYVSYKESMDVVKFAEDHDARLMTGEYKFVWRAVLYARLNEKPSQGHRIFGAAIRATAIGPELDQQIALQQRDKVRTRALCVKDTVQSCISMLNAATSFNWRFVQNADCADPCSILEVIPNQL